jgi:hypothetical protein
MERRIKTGSFGGSKLFQKGSAENERFLGYFGWAIVTFFSLTALRSWWNGESTSLLTFGGLLIGLWLVLSRSRFIGISDSARVILQEGRSGKKVLSHQVHSGPKAKKNNGLSDTVRDLCLILGAGSLAIAYAWIVSLLFSQPDQQLMALLLIPVIGFSYSLVHSKKTLSLLSLAGVYFLLVAYPASFSSLAFLTLLTVLLSVWTRYSGKWDVLPLSAIGSFLVIATYTSDYGTYSELSQAILVSTLLIGLALSAPFAYHRRLADNRNMAQASLALVVFGIAMLPGFFTAQIGLPGFMIIGLLYVLIFSALAVVSWWTHGRFSYAKYYGLAAALLVSILALVVTSRSETVLVWLILGSLLSASGFTLKSYTLRMSGLVLLMSTFAYYVLYVFPYETYLSGPFVLQERIWIGLLFAGALPLLALKYKDLKVAGPEGHFRSTIIAALYLASYAVMAGLILVGIQMPIQVLAWASLGIIGVWWGLRQGLPLIQAVSIATILTSLGHFLFSALAIHSPEMRGMFFLAFGLILIGIALAGSTYSRKNLL